MFKKKPKTKVKIKTHGPGFYEIERVFKKIEKLRKSYPNIEIRVELSEE